MSALARALILLHDIRRDRDAVAFLYRLGFPVRDDLEDLCELADVCLGEVKRLRGKDQERRWRRRVA